MKAKNKRGISPLVATVLLVAFAVALGAIVMNWARGVDEGPEAGTCILEAPIHDSNPLKLLQIKYIIGEITQQQYLAQERAVLASG